MEWSDYSTAVQRYYSRRASLLRNGLEAQVLSNSASLQSDIPGRAGMAYHEDPRLKGKRPDLKDQVFVPDVLIQAHSAGLSLLFYDRNAFPAEYRGDAFVALHGSWNRPKRTGYKVIRVRIKDGQPTGEYQDFVTGFALDDDNVWARPAGVAVTRDGALLVSDDANGTIFRITSKASP